MAQNSNTQAQAHPHAQAHQQAATGDSMDGQDSLWLSRSWELLTGSSAPTLTPNESAEPASAWENLTEVTAQNAKVTLLRSRRSGLQVYAAEIDSPAVFGLWCVRSADALLPTSLLYPLSRAMVDVGSEDFPFPSVMRKISFKTLTQVEPLYSFPTYIAYSILSLSDEGFLTLLPILGDVLLFPDWAKLPHTPVESTHRTLFEFTCASLIDNANPVKPSSLPPTNERVLRQELQSLHRRTFVPSEMCIIVCGRLPPDVLAKHLDPIDIKAARAFPFTNPSEERKCNMEYKSSMQLLHDFWTSHSVEAEVNTFPNLFNPWGSERNLVLRTQIYRSIPVSPSASAVLRRTDLSILSPRSACTMVCLVWPGPSSSSSQETLLARIMWQYLAEGPNAPLRLTLCNDTRLWRSNSSDIMQLDDVVEPYLVPGPPGFHGVIVRVEKQECELICADVVVKFLHAVGENLMMDRMKKVVRSQRLDVIETMEESAGEKIACDLMQIFLTNSEELNEAERVNGCLESPNSSFQSLPVGSDVASSSFWANVSRQLFTTSHPVCVSLSKPQEDHDCQQVRGGLSPAAPPDPEAYFQSSALAAAQLVTSVIVDDPPAIVGDPPVIDPLSNLRVNLHMSNPALDAQTSSSLEVPFPMPSYMDHSVPFTDVTSVGDSSVFPISSLTPSMLQIPGALHDQNQYALSEPASVYRYAGQRIPSTIEQNLSPEEVHQRVIIPRAVNLSDVPMAGLYRELSCKCVSVTSWPQGFQSSIVCVTTSGEVSFEEKERLIMYLKEKGLPTIDVVSTESVHSFDPSPSSNPSEPPLSFLFQMDCVATSFVDVCVWLDTSDLADDLRLYLEMFIDIIFSLPVACPETGQHFNVEELTKNLREDLVHYSSSIGTSRSNFICGTWAQSVCITLKAEADKYHKAVRWLQRLLYFSQFDVESVRTAAMKLMTDAQDNMKDPLSIAYALASLASYEPASNHAATNFISQMTFLGGVLHKLSSNPGVVLDALHQMRTHVTCPERLRVHVVCSPTDQAEPITPWRSFVPSATELSLHSYARGSRPSGRVPIHPSFVQRGRIPMIESKALRTEDALRPRGKFLVVDCEMDVAVDNCVCVTSAVEISFISPILPALLATMEYLAIPESELCVQLQRVGADLPHFGCDPETGLMFLTMYGVRDVLKCLETARSTLEDLASGRSRMDESALQDMLHVMLVDAVERGASPSRAGLEGLYNLFRGVESNYNTTFAQQLRQVTVEDVRSIIQSHVLNLFNPITALSVCVTTELSGQRKQEFRSRAHGYMVEILTLRDCVHKAATWFSEDSSDTCSTNDSEATSASVDSRQRNPPSWFTGYYDAICQLPRTQPGTFQLVAVTAAVAASTLAILMAQKKS